jgi:hypothetical protein
MAMAASASAAFPFPASDPLSRAARPRTAAAPARGDGRPSQKTTSETTARIPIIRPPSPGRVYARDDPPEQDDRDGNRDRARDEEVTRVVVITAVRADREQDNRERDGCRCDASASAHGTTLTRRPLSGAASASRVVWLPPTRQRSTHRGASPRPGPIAIRTSRGVRTRARVRATNTDMSSRSSLRESDPAAGQPLLPLSFGQVLDLGVGELDGVLEPGDVSQINSSSRLTMGCRSGITRSRVRRSRASGPIASWTAPSLPSHVPKFPFRARSGP